MSSSIYLGVQIRATKALLKFCLEHNNNGEYVQNIKACLGALEFNNIDSAIECYLKVPLGGNGCLNDWWPPVVFPNETEEYVWAVFEGLLLHWSYLMSQLKIMQK